MTYPVASSATSLSVLLSGNAFTTVPAMPPRALVLSGQGQGRNATFEHWGLKRLPVYGQPRGKAFVFLADVWSNLTTMARLFREATAATGV